MYQEQWEADPGETITMNKAFIEEVSDNLRSIVAVLVGVKEGRCLAAARTLESLAESIEQELERAEEQSAAQPSEDAEQPSEDVDLEHVMEEVIDMAARLATNGYRIHTLATIYKYESNPGRVIREMLTFAHVAVSMAEQLEEVMSCVLAQEEES